MSKVEKTPIYLHRDETPGLMPLELRVERDSMGRIRISRQQFGPRGGINFSSHVSLSDSEWAAISEAIRKEVSAAL
jgi:hypothetical protein